MGFVRNVINKLNPAQHDISGGGIVESTSSDIKAHQDAYELIEVVNRGVNMIVDDVAEIKVKVGDPIQEKRYTKGIKKVTLKRILNETPNPFQDFSTFKRSCVADFLLDGNIFIYYDGVHLYHLPACKMHIHTSTKNYVEKYTYNERIDYRSNEIIHIQDNSFKTVFRGFSRLECAKESMNVLIYMKRFQKNFFKNDAVPGLVLRSPNILSSTVKERMVQQWAAKYNPRNGGRRPLILDGGLELDQVWNGKFRELDFNESIKTHEDRVLKALGVPPILLDSGNNANINPNLRLYYLETVVPIVRKINFAFQGYFGFSLEEDVSKIPALRPELSEEANYYSSLVNGGIITVNEARRPLGLPPLDPEDGDEIRVPANIAGSAVDPSSGGRPEDDE